MLPTPKFSVNYIFRSENKKDVGVISSVLIPELRPSHCPFSRISNASQPTPSDYTNKYTVFTFNYTKVKNSISI